MTHAHSPTDSIWFSFLDGQTFQKIDELHKRRYNRLACNNRDSFIFMEKFCLLRIIFHCGIFFIYKTHIFIIHFLIPPKFN